MAFHRPVAPATPAVSALGGPRRAAAGGVDTVFTAHLFGDRVVPVRQAVVGGDGAGLSDLDIVLVGVVAAGKDSLALLSVSGQPVEPYALGKEISSGAVLDRVEADRILVRRGGKIVTVLLSGAPERRRPPPRPPASPPSRPTGSP